MLRSNRWLLFSLALTICTLISACSKSSTPPPGTSAQPPAEAPSDHRDIGTKPAEPATPPPAPVKPPVPMVPPPEPDQVASTTGSKSSAADPAEMSKKPGAKGTQRVTLGAASPELYAGIPGGGDLGVPEIKKWLADPKNHEELDVRLPLGLSAGQAQMQGLKDDPLTRAKIELGRQMYFDTRLSSDATVSCASCHDPDEGFAAHSQFGIGVQKQMGGRNSPVAYNRILSTSQFWDGRAKSLEDQAKGPIANPIEMANTHEECEKCIKAIEGYRLQFEKIFGGVTIDHVAKAIAAFERSLVSGASPFDYYEQWRAVKDLDPEDLQDDKEQLAAYNAAKAGYEKNKMSESAVRGRDIFFGEKGSCTACHVGPNLSDEKYHNLGIGMSAKEPDLGRYAITKKDEDRGAFKTPTIRNVAQSAPYMHDGSVKTLEEVIDWYDKGGHPNSSLDPKIKKLNLSKQDKADLLAFMQACTGPFPKIERGRLPK
ncbi:MAG TPA: cytochrome c peroxidase [Pirellulales bacterium]|jgi:cytochrome c peroxidase|nr:cytochrome c peroxidase [Pirellulales bacterium]